MKGKGKREKKEKWDKEEERITKRVIWKEREKISREAERVKK